MPEFEREMAMRRIMDAEKVREKAQRRDRLLFVVCASCLTLVAILPRGPHLAVFYLAALGTWLVLVDALSIPKSWGEDSDVRWHFFRPLKIIENGFSKGKGWQTLILMSAFVVSTIVSRLK